MSNRNDKTYKVSKTLAEIIKNLNFKIWQRNYWEHIIRNEAEYNRISQYIIDNPEKWEKDRLR